MNHPLLHRVAAIVLVPAQLLLGVPLLAAEAPGALPKPPKAPEVKVNRTPSKVKPPQAPTRFSAEPTDEEIFRARMFEEPMVPLGESGPAAENRALAEALLQYRERADPDDVSALTGFLDAHRQSRWRASVLTNLGLAYRWTGRFPKAMESWEEAWTLAKDDETLKGRAVADRAIGELASMNARLGRYERVQELLEETKGRDVINARDRLTAAKDGFAMMTHMPEKSFRCGPLSLSRILAAEGRPAFNRKIMLSRSTREGMSLVQVADLAKEIDLNYQMAFRESGDLVLPSMVHWKAGHYAAIVQKDELKNRYLIQDPTFGEDFWASQKVLDEETSGYFLIPAGLPEGWREVGTEEGAKVWGKGHINGREQGATTQCDAKSGGSGESCKGAAVYSVHSMLASLNIVDTPLWYNPPRGPAVEFTVTYNHQEAYQPGVFSYSNFGASWTFDWLSYVNDDPVHPQRNLTLYARGGGTLTFTGTGSDGETAPEPMTQAKIRRAAANEFDPSYTANDIAYVVEYPDGSEDVYYQSDYSAAYPRKIFLKEIRDPQKNKLTLIYDAKFRIVEVIDAIGQVTTLSYELPGDDLKVTRVTDPFGRSARFEYSAGRLIKIFDIIDLNSSFTYGEENFIVSLRTPYGTSHFHRHSEGLDREWVDAVDPLGGRERVEWRMHGHGHEGGGDFIPGIHEEESTVPGAFGCLNCVEEYAYGSNTFYWDKRAMDLAPGDYLKAKNTRWLTSYTIAGRGKWSDKKPLENRVYYFYPDQGSSFSSGSSNLPIRTSRVIGTGAGGRKIEQTELFEYNSKGKVTRYTDPVGRATIYTYGNDDIDLTSVKQANGPNVDTLASYTYNNKHQPLTYTDANGETTTLTYNAYGQLLTASQVVGGRTDTWTLAYDPSGYLLGLTGPRPGATLGLTWDGFGRPRTLTNSDNYTVTLDYDGMSRPLKVTYPNGTYEELVWDRLHPSKYRDLSGRWAEIFVDALRRPTGIHDALGRLTSLQWCDCGSLDKLTDANGKSTSWERDLQGRITAEKLADGSRWTNTYETTTSRIVKQEDPRGATAYTYNIDDTLGRIDYLTTTGQPRPDTPPLGFTYDPNYRRLKTRTDGTGTTTYAYNPVSGQPASGRIASIDGQLANDLIQYGYDDVGRVNSRAINGATVSATFDPLGRVATVANPLGNFAYNYEGNTQRLLGVLGPNGFERAYSYFDQAGDRQLKTITNKVGTNVVSKFDYTYLPSNEIASWTQQQGGPAKRYDFGYDAADQLTSATLRGAGTSQVLKRYSYAYDAGQNRVSEQVDNVLTASAHNSVNQLTSQSAGGSLRIAGHTDEPATVTVGPTSAQTSVGNAFAGSVPVGTGATSVTVAATDANANTSTKVVNVTTTGGNRTLSYDGNGNLISDGAKTYEWDGLDRLLAINDGTKRTEFTYDGYSRRTRIVEKNGGTVTSDKRLLWCGSEICEERDAAGATTTKRFYGQGVQVGATNLLYGKDHLGSVRELIDTTGAVRARYDYDPYGRRTKTTGDLDADFGYTRHLTHATTGLNLALYRAYDPGMGRWLSQDPIGDGLNLYGYVGNNPISRLDPLGLSWKTFKDGFWNGLIVGAAVGIALAFASPAIVAAAAIGGLVLGVTQFIELYYRDQAGTLCVNDADYILGNVFGGILGGRGGWSFGRGIRSGVPDARIVVRGGERPPDPESKFSGAYGKTLEEAGAGVRNNKVQETTAGEIRKAGGEVTLNPEEAYPGGPLNWRHVDVKLGSGQPFGPPKQNPAPKECRPPKPPNQ